MGHVQSIAIRTRGAEHVEFVITLELTGVFDRDVRAGVARQCQDVVLIASLNRVTIL